LHYKITLQKEIFAQKKNSIAKKNYSVKDSKIKSPQAEISKIKLIAG
jgi:hypothetical protein